MYLNKRMKEYWLLSYSILAKLGVAAKDEFCLEVVIFALIIRKSFVYHIALELS